MVTKAFYIHSPSETNSGSDQNAVYENGESSQCYNFGFGDVPSFEIHDKSLGHSIRVPCQFTVFQEVQSTPSSGSTSGSSDSARSSPQNPDKSIKLKFFLVGNDICPDFSRFNCSLIYRIEFHGSICSDAPVFEIIHRLTELKKVKFFLGKKQLLFFRSSTTDESFIERFKNKGVTSLTIVTEESYPTSQPGTPDDLEYQDRHLREIVLEEIVAQLLMKAADCFPRLRKLTMHVMNTLKTRNAVIDAFNKLQYLNPSIVDNGRTLDRLTVKKIDSPSLRHVQNDEEAAITASTHIPDIIKSDAEELLKMKGASSNEVSETDDSTQSQNTDENDELSSESEGNLVDLEEQEVNNDSKLTDLGKLLESMLGIGIGSPQMNLNEEVSVLGKGKELT